MLYTRALLYNTHYEGQSWGFISCSTAMVVLGQVLALLLVGIEPTERGHSVIKRKKPANPQGH